MSQLGHRELDLAFMGKEAPHVGFPEAALPKYAEKLLALGHKVRSKLAGTCLCDGLLNSPRLGRLASLSKWRLRRILRNEIRPLHEAQRIRPCGVSSAQS